MEHKSPIMQMNYQERGSRRELPVTKECHKCLEIAVAAEKKLLDTISDRPDIRKLYEAANDAIEDLHSQQLDDCYAEAFRFGFLLALDVVEYKND